MPRACGNLFSRTHVGRGKPFPDLFLYAAAQMGARPEACVVVEDSIPGAWAGFAAGMKVLGYAGGLSDGDALAKEGARVFVDMTELPALLGEARPHNAPS